MPQKKYLTLENVLTDNLQICDTHRKVCELYNSCNQCIERTKSNSMTKTTLSEARNNLPELVNRASYGQERIVIERRGKPVAAIVSLEDVARLEAFEDARDSALLIKAMEDSLGFITIDELLSARPIN